MPDSTSEAILKAFLMALEAAKPAGARVERNAVLPDRIPSAGLLILRDGDPGDPETLLSPTHYIFQHVAEVDVLVEGRANVREATFDALKQSVAAAVAADRTLGGLCDWIETVAPAPLELPLEGADAIKGATIGVVLHYQTDDPLT